MTQGQTVPGGGRSLSRGLSWMRGGRRWRHTQLPRTLHGRCKRLHGYCCASGACHSWYVLHQLPQGAIAQPRVAILHGPLRQATFVTTLFSIHYLGKAMVLRFIRATGRLFYPASESPRCVVLSPAARSAGMPHDVAAAALKKNLEVAFKIEGTQWGRRYCPESMAFTRSLNPETECSMFPCAAQATFQALKANCPARYELSKLLDVGSPLLIPGSEVRTRKQS
jgi:hypothetical protein